MGGYDASHASGDFKYYPLVAEDYWRIKLDALSDGSSNAYNVSYGIVDTGTSVLVGPTDVVNQIWSGGQTIDCSKIDTLPTLTFTIGGDDYVITPEELVLQVTVLGETECMVGI